MSKTALRDYIIELVENTEFMLQWAVEEYEIEENVEVYMIWDDDETYRD